MKLLFMGTPDFARIILEQLIQSEHTIVGVVTQPDKPKGRGYVMIPPPVKEYAQKQGLPVYQPTTLRDGAFDETLTSLAPDAVIVAAYGKILPSSILHTPPYGCLNIHGSLLPAYRGAAPIQRAMMDGVPETGVTIMQMDEGLDTGDMLAKAIVPITDEDDFGTIHDKMAYEGANALLKVLSLLTEGEVLPEVQPSEGATYAAKIEKEDCRLDFTRSAEELFWQIRALSPFPLAGTALKGTILKPAASVVVEKDGAYGIPGTVLSLDHGIDVACGKGILRITSLVPAGKSRMSAADFIRGRKIAVMDVLG